MLDAVQLSGAGIGEIPDTESQMGMGYAVAWKTAYRGSRKFLGIDITSIQCNDSMAQMRLALQTQRDLDYDRAVDGQVRRKLQVYYVWQSWEEQRLCRWSR